MECMFSQYPGSQIDGIDYSAESVRMSRKRDAKRLGKKYEIRQGDVMMLPYPNKSYDVAMAIAAIYFCQMVRMDFARSVGCVCPAADGLSAAEWGARKREACGQRDVKACQFIRLLKFRK